MMKKALTMISLVLLSALLLVSCGKGKKETTTSSRREEYIKLRREFVDSDVYREAIEYLKSTLAKHYPDVPFEMSLEPGGYEKGDVDDINDFASNEKTRLDFFSTAYLTFSIRYDDYDFPVTELIQYLIDNQITGELYSPLTSSSFYYKIDAVKGTYEQILVPGV